MRTKYPHAFSLDRCQFPSGSVATPSGHAHFAAVVPQGYRGEWSYRTFTENQVNKPATKLRMTLLQNFVPPSHKTMYHLIQSFVRQIQRILQRIRSRLEKIDFHTMEYVLECLRNNATKVRNIRSYMLPDMPASRFKGIVASMILWYNQCNSFTNRNLLVVNLNLSTC